MPAISEGMVLTDVTSETIDAVVRTAGAGAGPAVLSLEIRQLGGAIGRGNQDNGALASLDDGFIVFSVGIAPVPPAAAAVQAGLEAIYTALEPWRGERQVLGWRESKTAPTSLFGPSLARLQQIKADVDPDNMLQSNHPLV